MFKQYISYLSSVFGTLGTDFPTSLCVPEILTIFSWEFGIFFIDRVGGGGALRFFDALDAIETTDAAVAKDPITCLWRSAVWSPATINVRIL